MKVVQGNGIALGTQGMPREPSQKVDQNSHVIFAGNPTVINQFQHFSKLTFCLNFNTTEKV